VSLPPVTFALSGTMARTSALFLRREATAARRLVLARAEHVGYVTRAGLPVVDPAGDELPALAAAVVAAATSSTSDTSTSDTSTSDGDDIDVVRESPLVAVADLRMLGPLDPARLDPAALAARRSLLDAGGVSLSEYLTPVGPRRCREVTTPFVSVLHVDDLGAVDWHAARCHAPLTPGVLAEPGELIVSLLNPASLRAAAIPPGEAVQVSAEFGVFRSTMDVHAVVALLHSPAARAQLRPLGTGTSSSRRRIGPQDVLSLVVPKLDPSVVEALATTVRGAQRDLTAARDRLRTAYSGRSQA
jgi:hypothetical protein